PLACWISIALAIHSLDHLPLGVRRGSYDRSLHILSQSMGFESKMASKRPVAWLRADLCVAFKCAKYCDILRI
ncbi:MAG: hypothetical protein OXI86_09590, partial [Candidatus Poribacteria bacterium]|nr:hypothetical protein [Candidatus Poribacteria bacterium]